MHGVCQVRARWWRDGGAMVARWWRIAAVAAATLPPFCYQIGIEYAALPMRCRCAGAALLLVML